MRYLLLLLALSCPAFGAVAHVTASNGFGLSGSHGGNVTANCGSGTSFAFTYTATSASDVVVIQVGTASASTTNVMSLAATGWTFNAMTCTGATSCTSGTFGASANRVAAFWAVPPNTTLATITATIGLSVGNFCNDLIDEFSGVSTSSPIDVNTAAAGTTGSCTANVTPTQANDGLWGACNDSVTAVGSTYTVGANDTQGDWSEFKILSGGSGVSQTVNFTGTSGTWEGMVAALKPTGAAATCTNFIALSGMGCK